MRFRISVTAALCLAASPVLAQSYDFDSLSLGPLAGQDGWTSPFTPSPDVFDGGLYSSANTTHVARGSYPGAAVSLRPRGMPSTALNSSVLGMDTTLGGGSSLAIFGLANTDDDAAFVIGVQQAQSPSFFFYRRSSMFAGNNSLTVPIGIGSGSTDWYRLLANVDYAANGGDGSASLFVEDLTLGQTSFSPIAGMQNLNLGMTAGNLATIQIKDWIYDEIRVDGAGMVDNLYAGQAVATDVTPESGSLTLFTGPALLGGLCLLRRRIRKVV